MPKIKRALISVSDKTGLVEFAKELARMGVELISTEGTARALLTAKVPVVEIADYTDSPEILDGRLKTLHPNVHGGILARRDDKNHIRQLMENDIGLIDMVVVNLYPFEATVAKEDCTFDEAIENIDIGGPTMLKSAAKNHKFVAAIVDSTDYDAILSEMKDNNNELSESTCFRLAKKVFATTSRYDVAISNYLSSLDDNKEGMLWPQYYGVTFERVQSLRYGENPHQDAAFYRNLTFLSEPSIVNSRQIQGKELSYNNIMDADAVLEIIKELDDYKYAAVIVKHANPCGAAISEDSLLDAYKKAFATDPTSAFGGIIGVNRPVDEMLASHIAETFYEVIIAPSFDPSALKIFEKKKNLRLIEVLNLGKNPTAQGITMRKVVGGVLLQSRDISHEDVKASKVMTKRQPTADEVKALGFAWKICKHTKSNAIVFATTDCTLGIGAGQTSRVDSSKIASDKMKAILGNEKPTIVVASDAFFPFRDGIDVVAKAGATAVVEPGGSLKDEEVIDAANEHGIALVFTGVRHFRH